MPSKNLVQCFLLINKNVVKSLFCKNVSDRKKGSIIFRKEKSEYWPIIKLSFYGYKKKQILHANLCSKE